MPCTLLLALACGLTPAPAAAPASAPAPTGLTLRWYGQAAVLLTTPDGARVLMDPIPAEVGYSLPKEPLEADVVTVSHEHPDHGNVAMARGAKVLRGLTAGGKEWGAKIDVTEKGVRIRGVPTFHDAEGGAKRGKNMVFVFEAAGKRIVHLGDLGHELTPEQVTAIGPVDVLLVPVGGHFTIGPELAARVVAQLAPRQLVIPIHYRTPAMKDTPLGPVEDFLAKFPAARRASDPILSIPAAPPAAGFEVVVLPYQ